jgi:hypothetical protein
MSTAAIRQRVAKLEIMRDAGAARQHVIEARSEDEAERKEAELIASGAARPNDLFVVIRRFAAEDLAA